jgi:branched-chain amino acid transport system ATP-binding protein
MHSLSENILELENVSTAYGRLEVLHQVSIQVRRGEIVAIVGSNGAGKSTLLKTISRLLPLNSGKVIYGGKQICDCKAFELVSLGIAHVPEGRRVFPRMTVKENLELGAFSQKLERGDLISRLHFVFELFPVLNERGHQLAGTLSGGEQQMLAIGRALMSKPQLLLLDEPSMGIAPLLVQKIFETIEELNKSGISILLVEQDAEAALSISNRGYVLETGRVVLADSAEVLLNHAEVKKAYLGG